MTPDSKFSWLLCASIAIVSTVACVEPPRSSRPRVVVPRGRPAPALVSDEPLAVDESEDERMVGNGAAELTGPVEALRAGHAQAALARFVEVERDELRSPFVRELAELYIAKALLRLELPCASWMAFDALAARPGNALHLRVLPWVALLADAIDTDAAGETLGRFEAGDLAAMGKQPKPIVERLSYLFGRRAMLAGKPDEALDLLGAVSATSPDHARALYLTGVLHVGAGRRDEGLAAFVAAEEAGWAMPGGDAAEELRKSAQLARARLLYELGAEDKARLEEAHGVYLKAIQSPGNPDDARLELASTLYQLERFDEAADALAAARPGIDERDPEAAVMGAAIDVQRCRLDEAEARLSRVRAHYQAARAGAAELAKGGADPRLLPARGKDGRSVALALASHGGAIERGLLRRKAITAEKKRAAKLPLDFAASATGVETLALIARAEAHNEELLGKQLGKALAALEAGLAGQLERMEQLEVDVASARASCAKP
jgi:hypothetical protein